MRNQSIPAFIFAVTLLGGTALAAPEHKNPQVLPKTITADELKKTMQGSTKPLGVKCTFCHALEQYANDEWRPKSNVRRMSRDLVRHATLLDVILLRKPQMFFRCDVAQHTGSVPRRIGRANATGDMVITREHIRHERAQHIERSPVTQCSLELHVELNLIQRHMPRTFDHHRHTFAPGSFG